ncbi:MAG: DUF952 domain-containing protein [Rhodobiaceae bacterium]|nr:DUF952 domain-containing protein [Rhodobiaceae bacterium]
MSVATIYKIVAKDEWAAVERAGVFKGASIDLADGYIHFSTADQARQTAALHFAGRGGLLLVAVATAPLGDALKWEPSRGGDLFPHLYGELSVKAVSRVDDLPLDDKGAHIFPPMEDA